MGGSSGDTAHTTAGSLLLASDHAGLGLKQELAGVLAELGYAVRDLGTGSAESCDYPDYGEAMAAALARGDAERGVLVCGTGVGIAMAANRHAHVRAAVCQDVTTARLARAHNDANVLALGARVVGSAVARDVLEAFLATSFAGGRHARRVAKLSGEAAEPAKAGEAPAGTG